MGFNVKLNNTPKPKTKIDPAQNPTIGQKLAQSGAIIGGAIAAGGIIAALNALTKTQKNDVTDFTTGNFSFPSDLDQYNAYIEINFTSYKRRSIFAPVFEDPKGGIRLPLPRGMTDKFGVTYNNKNQDAAVGGAIENALAASETGKGIGGVVNSAIEGGVAGAAIRSVENIVSGIGQALGKTSASAAELLQLGGLAQNPFMTVLFEKPEFKDFTFSWKLAPSTPRESEILNEIIRKFKYHMLPGLQPGYAGTLLTYPDMAIIKFNKDDFLYKFKHCVVKDMSINYAPGSAPSLFDGGANAPVEVELQIHFQEIEYWLKEDISSEFGTRIGKYTLNI